MISALFFLILGGIIGFTLAAVGAVGLIRDKGYKKFSEIPTPVEYLKARK